MNDTECLLNAIGQALYDKKGSNILALDVRKISDLTDYCVIVEGNVGRHVKALCNNVVDAAKQIGANPYFTEGETESDWVVIDFGDVIVHIMIPEMRERYRLEELWKNSDIVDLAIDVKRVSFGE